MKIVRAKRKLTAAIINMQMWAAADNVLRMVGVVSLVFDEAAVQCAICCHVSVSCRAISIGGVSIASVDITVKRSAPCADKRAVCAN